MGKKILLADDSITIQKVIELTFSDEDFEVVTVGNGRLAIEKLEEVRPDVVLCDIIMPEKDGYEVCDHIKKHPTLSYVPVLLLTGAFEPFDQERASRVGCDGFLAKPFEPQALIAKVKDLLAQSAARPRPASAPSGSPMRMEEPEAETMPRAPTSFTRPTPPTFSAPAPPVAPAVTFVPEEPVVEEARAGTFDAPMELSTGPDEAAPYESASAVEDLFSIEEPVVAAPEEFMPLMADEAEALRPPPFTTPGAPAFAPELEPAFEPEPPPVFVAPPPPAFEPPRLEPAAFAPKAAPEPMVDEDDGASTVVFRAGETPPWSQPTTELSFEMRAQAMAKQQSEAVSAPVFEEVVEEEGLAPAKPEPFEPEPMPEAAFEPPPPPPAFVPPPPPAVFERFVAAAQAPAAPPLLKEPEESFAALAAPPRPVEVPAASAAAEVAVPVDQVAQIAQRVVAQISEKVVREVAWEVIPDLAEALIKKEIERLRAELERT